LNNQLPSIDHFYLVKPRLVWALAHSELFTRDLAVLRINNELISY